MSNEKKKLLFDKIANGYLLFAGYEFLFFLYLLLYISSGQMTFKIGIVLAIIDSIMFLLTCWVFGAVLYNIYSKI